MPGQKLDKVFNVANTNQQLQKVPMECEMAVQRQQERPPFPTVTMYLPGLYRRFICPQAFKVLHCSNRRTNLLSLLLPLPSLRLTSFLLK